MKLYLDCEFNDFKGALISMALVDENGREWYEVVQCENPSPWVAEHVMPILGRGPVSIPMMQASLSAWLSLYDSVHVVADWPEDIAHFCQALITGPGVRLNTPPLTMEVVRIDATSELPHNALADARGIRAALAAREPAQAVAVPDGLVRVIREWKTGIIGSNEAMVEVAMLAAAPSADKVAVPDGFVMVPLEPTTNMLIAGVKANYGRDGVVGSIYRAMLAAAKEAGR